METKIYGKPAYKMQDRQPLAAAVEIPQSLQDQANEQLKLLDGDPVDEELQAEMVKVWGSVGSDSVALWF